MEYAVGSWPQPFRVILKAEVMALGDNARFVVTSLDLPTPELLINFSRRAKFAAALPRSTMNIDVSVLFFLEKGVGVANHREYFSRVGKIFFCINFCPF